MSNQPFILISVMELRQNFGAVRSGLAQGKQYIVIYRGEPIAELTPTTKETFDMFFASGAKRIQRNVAARKRERIRRKK
jgi:antitoxin (DNA-binding transcriptional repressor) of toxin-antitoxin stability system